MGGLHSKQNDECLVMQEDIPFTRQMRIATRKIHEVSDALVNAKLAFAMSDNSVWAEGLLVFYEIFRYLEEAMVRLKGTPVGEYHFEELMRTEAFQKDLELYLGKDWTTNYSPRESVAKYILHLQAIERQTPILLVAYIYHLYMGLLSGGQILGKKRELARKFIPFSKKQIGDDAVTSFGDHSIASIKKKIVKTTNDIALVLDYKAKEMLIEESKLVYALNNTLVKSVKGTNFVVMKKAVVVLAIVISCPIFYYLFF